MHAAAPVIPKAYDTGTSKTTKHSEVEKNIRIISFVRKGNNYYCQIIKPKIEADQKLSCKTTFKQYNGTTKLFQNTPDIESFQPNVAPLCKLVQNDGFLPIYALMAKFNADRLTVLIFLVYYFTKFIRPANLFYTHDRSHF